MIRYTLKCDQEHGFESWFQNADAFEALANAGHIACPTCGSSKVKKSLMTPRVTPARTKAAAPAAAPQTASAPTAAPEPYPQAQPAPPPDLAQIKADIEKNSDYVGAEFAKEARAMHEGESPERAIYGEAAPAEALKLLDDGIPVLPLPFIPTRKTN